MKGSLELEETLVYIYKELAGLPLEEILILSEVDSTNDIARGRLELKSSVLVVAESQRAGRGRGGRRWESPRGGLWFSLGFREDETLGPGGLPLGFISILTGVAVAEALRGMGFKARLKWPNDVLIDDKKVAGILVEVDLQGGQKTLVIGIGVNVNIPEEELQKRVEGTRVGTLSGLAGRQISRVEVLSRILEEFFREWELWRSGRGRREGILRRWKELSSTLNREVTVISASGGEEITGVAIDLAPDGALLIRGPDGRLRRIIEGHVISCPELNS